MPPVLSRCTSEAYVPLRYQLSASGPLVRFVYIVYGASTNHEFRNCLHVICNNSISVPAFP